MVSPQQRVCLCVFICVCVCVWLLVVHDALEEVEVAHVCGRVGREGDLVVVVDHPAAVLANVTNVVARRCRASYVAYKRHQPIP